MDAATAERINNLAKNLKDLHLASSMEDAFQKAREIILDSSAPPVNAIVQEERLMEQAQTVSQEEQKENVQVNQVIEALEEIKQAETEDEANSVDLTKETVQVSEQLKKEQQELMRIREEIEQAKAALAEAKKVADTVPVIPSTQNNIQKQRAQLTEEEKKKSDLSSIFNFGNR